MSIETKDLLALAKRRPLLVACGLISFALGLEIYFRMDVRDTVQTKLEALEKDLSRVTDNSKYSAQLDGQLEALRKANATIESGALRAGELARNQQLFYKLEAETGVKLLDLRQLNVPAPAKGAAPVYVFIPFSLTIKGDYAQLLDFLQRLDHGATLCRVNTASISHPTDESQTISLAVELLGFRS